MEKQINDNGGEPDQTEESRQVEDQQESEEEEEEEDDEERNNDVEDEDEEFQPDEGELSSEDVSLAADQQLQISRRRKVIISDSTGISVDEQRERAQLNPSSSGLNLDSLGAADEDDDEADLMMAEKAFGQLTGSSEQQIGGEGQKQQRQRAKKQTIRIEELEDVDTEDLSTSAALHRELRNLSFKNPGERLRLAIEQREKRRASTKQNSNNNNNETFNVNNRPVRSTRKRTTLMREAKSSADGSGKNNKIRHNNKGKLVMSAQKEVDLCDCLDPECEGCQYRCKKCGGYKCSFACRVNRGQIIEYIDVLGSGRVNNPFL